MFNFSVYICILVLFSFCSSFKLHSNFAVPFVPTRIHKRSRIQSQFNNNYENVNSEDSKLTNSDEGWLMELNEKNVEGVFDLIRSQLSYDGGGIDLCKIVGNEIFVRFTGSCVGCPYRSTTLKEVIENNLTKFLKSPNGIPICVKVVENEN